jgi:hypothetical protein
VDYRAVTQKCEFTGQTDNAITDDFVKTLSDMNDNALDDMLKTVGAAAPAAMDAYDGQTAGPKALKAAKDWGGMIPLTNCD